MRPNRAIWLTTWMVCVVSSVPLHAQQEDGDCEFRRPVSANLAMSVNEALRVNANAGSLAVRGVQGLREARITGTACASSSRLLGEISVSARREAGGVLVETVFPQENSRNRQGWHEQTRIDLVIEVPIGVAAAISDGSGSMEISGLGDVEIEDGSGEITIHNIRGSLKLADGSGSIEITDVSGDIEVTDGSGEVSIRDAGGTVVVSDGSGSIDVRGVRGGFVVRTDGSGSVDWSNVTGRVDVPTKRRNH